MIKPRIVPEDQRMSGDAVVKAHDEFMRHCRDHRKLQTESILRSRIDFGCALEIGSGPGYEGLEWLKMTGDTTLKGLDASKQIVDLARKNAQDYSLASRAEYFVGDASRLPFGDGCFDAIISTGSLHQWTCPEETFAEIQRVLRPGGKYFISDLRRDMNSLMRWFVLISQLNWQKEIRSGLMSSLHASYTLQEVKDMLEGCDLAGWNVTQTPFRIVICGRKDYDNADRSVGLSNIFDQSSLRPFEMSSSRVLAQPSR